MNALRGRPLVEGNVYAVVPVKDFALAKQRLAPALSADQRRDLVRAMLCDVLETLAASTRLAGTIVITADPQAGLLARHYGARLLFEREVRGLNAAAANVATRLAAEQRAGMLVLPADIPGVSAAEIDRLVGAHPLGRAVSLVPAHDGQGTNALLVSPPAVLPFAFGALSFSRHVATAREAGLALMVHSPADFPGLSLDIDLPGDLAGLTDLRASAHTRRLLDQESWLLSPAP